MDRRSFLQTSTAAVVGSAMPVIAYAAGDEIVISSILDLSGGLDIYGKPMADCMTLAVEEQNAAGGLLGKRLRLVTYDPQSNMQLYAQFAQQAALKEKSAVVMGGITSASREVIRPRWWIPMVRSETRWSMPALRPLPLALIWWILLRRILRIFNLRRRPMTRKV